jgi:hypothetical protein
MEDNTTGVLIDEETSPLVDKKPNVLTSETDELLAFRRLHEGKSKKTYSIYVQQYKKLICTLQKDFKDATKEEIKAKVDSIVSTNSRNLMFMICIFCCQIYGEDDKAKWFVALRQKEKNAIAKNVRAKNKDLSGNLPDVEDVDGYLLTLDSQNRHKEFIINFLIHNYYIRNKDLDVKITKNLAETKNHELNYLVVLRTGIKFIRNVYKTVQKHGIQVHTCKDPMLRKHCLKFFLDNKKDNEELYLLNHHGTENIGSEVQRLTYKQLGEGKMFKINVLRNRNDINMIKTMSQTRGTGIDCLLENYDIENT